MRNSTSDMSETDLDRPQRTKYFHWSTYDVNHAKTPSDLCRMTWSTVMNTAERSNNLIVVRSSSSYGMSRSVRQNLCRTIHSSSLDDQLDTQTTRLEATFRRDDSRSVAPEQNWGVGDVEIRLYVCRGRMSLQQRRDATVLTVSVVIVVVWWSTCCTLDAVIKS